MFQSKIELIKHFIFSLREGTFSKAAHGTKSKV